MSRQNRKIQSQISKSLVNARISEKKILRYIKKIQKNESKLLREVRVLIDENRIKEARLMAVNIIDSRKIVQKLGKMRFFLRTIQYQFKEAQSALLQGETVESLVKVLGRTNKALSAESFDEAFIYLETEYETLSMNLEDSEQMLEDPLDDFEDPLDEEEEFVDNIIIEIGKVPKTKVNTKIQELIKIDSLLPKVPSKVIPQTNDDLTEEEDLSL
ncbi:MAG: Snf7 family protein [Candidatus Hodarchaeales archaeon]|jgi:hypothetical protein